MGKLGQTSFRRILLSRILLLSIPVLLTGEYVVYRKARSGFLETARQNLTESAVRKGEDMQAITEVLRASLSLAGQNFADQMNRPDAVQIFTQQMKLWLPERVQCVQLKNVVTEKIEGSTCGAMVIDLESKEMPPQRRLNNANALPNVSIAPSHLAIAPGQADQQRKLNLIFSAPIYDKSGQLRYLLNAQASLYRREISQGASLQGYTIVIDQDGVILAHPVADRVGRTIQQQPNAEVLEEIVKNAIAGQKDSLQLLEENGAEWLAGYSAVQMPAQDGKTQTWVVMAVAPITNALYDLKGIQQVLLILTLGLVAASLLATIYVAKELAAPLEQLGRYARQVCDRMSFTRPPRNFKIRELDQLASALDKMVERLEERADELETAWQEAQVANQLKSDFLATTSHELRTPLNAIIGCVRLVRDGCCDTPEEAVEFLQQADDAALHLLKIINDLLDISKIESGNVELNLQPVSIPRLCQQCLRMEQHRAEKKNIDLSMDVDQTLSEIPLDERRVRQMVINLLSNAVKFTPEGGNVKLSSWVGDGSQLAQENRLDHSPINPTTPYLCLEVIDSGIGIPKERWHLLFRPFQQIDSSLTRKHEGTGLGLALTKRLVELHGGTLSFKSVPGEGSVFRIWLPSPIPGGGKKLEEDKELMGG